MKRLFASVIFATALALASGNTVFPTQVEKQLGLPQRSQMDVVSLLDAGFSSPASVLWYNATYNYASGTTGVAGYEEVLLLAALTGLANRDAPRVLIDLEPSDYFWLTRASVPGGWLAHTSTETIPAPVENLVARLVDPAGIAGVVLFDPSVTCSSAVANTVAGAELLLPIAYRPDDPQSLYSRLVAGGPRLRVVRSLVGMFNGSATGSVKLDCYTWAVDEYIRANKSDASHLAYYVDYFWTTRPGLAGGGWEKATIPNGDYTISKGGFFFDLGVWDDEAPIDEPTQPLGADLAAFRLMLAAAYEQTGGNQIIRMHGFTPWAFKYVGPNSAHNHGGVDAEWATGKLISAFNAMDDGDACCIGNIANAAFYQHFPLADRFVQPPPPSEEYLKARGLLNADGSVASGHLFYFFYAGDYDSAAWISTQLIPRWEDVARGETPIGWGLDPGLSTRFPLVWPIVYDSLTPGRDVIITGDSGAGYLNPTMLYGPQRANVSGLPDGVAPWVALNTALNRQFNLRFTGFSISGDAPLPTKFDDAVFANFSSHGVVNQGWPSLHAYLNNNLPVVTQSDLSTDVGDAAKTIADHYKSNASWMMFRSVLTSPTFLTDVATNATALTEGAAVVVTPYEISALMRVALGGSNDDFVSYVDDTLPTSARSGSLLAFNATLRNDGWNIIHSSAHGLVVRVTSVQEVVDVRARFRRDVAAGGFVALDAGAGVTQASRRILARAGFVGRPIERISGVPDVVFRLRSDLAVGGHVTVAAAVQIPTLRAAEVTAIVEVEYQLAQIDAEGNVVAFFQDRGNIPWVAPIVAT
jgi:hypothetical protein